MTKRVKNNSKLKGRVKVLLALLNLGLKNLRVDHKEMYFQITRRGKVSSPSL